MKAVLYYPLLWLRGPVRLLARLLGGLFTFGGLAWAAFTLSDQSHSIPWGYSIGLLIAGFVLFILAHLYDQLRLKLNLHNTDLILLQ